MDEIRLTGLTFYGYHGANPEETLLGQRFEVDAFVYLELSRAAESDALDDTVSYSAVYKLIRREVEGEPSKLLEHLAGRIVGGILALDARIDRVRVCVTKPSPPLKGIAAGGAGVCLERRRD
ncbi:MAG TPA: dihydroneopterin aldolase [Chloroflexia bacterium]|nr:dihydroneopterin aldolase [Chloroflexia bacterium]